MLAKHLFVATVSAAAAMARPLLNIKRDDFGLEWMTKDGSSSSLPKIVYIPVLTSNYSRLDNINYGDGVSPTAQELVSNYSEILDIAQIAFVHFPASSDSAGLNSTNTLKDTTYISHDGPSNLYQAFAVAADPKAWSRGGLVVFNDRISHWGRAIWQPYWFFEPSYPVARGHFDLQAAGLTSGDELPSVVVLFGSQGFDASLMYAAVANGAKGIVVQGSGAGKLSPNAVTAAADLKEKGIPVVASLRPVTGASVPPPYVTSYISSGYMQADKSRVQLQLCLAVGAGWDGCQEAFEKDMREAIYNRVTTYYY
ncbi:hypothetical protein L198_03833 [Cryptococcus wingfieldii CBS 7118]|uniref:asparaginase n=1 Tax=Cryptococcus wingfieldii CBS 7118 TaxID=1295528 RepID=A0A1E3J8S0_9TREE|nr:hypothetical protein L198_03833 [Cryptococcus wingfieldii CBS 7118]ODN97270.1 hypothetical protein L198_03833 [Cryptococcus wingfieldii CBS 7118]